MPTQVFHQNHISWLLRCSVSLDTPVVQRRILGSLMNNKFENIRKEATFV
jgi:hypothetical protein